MQWGLLAVAIEFSQGRIIKLKKKSLVSKIKIKYVFYVEPKYYEESKI